MSAATAHQGLLLRGPVEGQVPASPVGQPTKAPRPLSAAYSTTSYIYDDAVSTASHFTDRTAVFMLNAGGSNKGPERPLPDLMCTLVDAAHYAHDQRKVLHPQTYAYSMFQWRSKESAEGSGSASATPSSSDTPASQQPRRSYGAALPSPRQGRVSTSSGMDSPTSRPGRGNSMAGDSDGMQRLSELGESNALSASPAPGDLEVGAHTLARMHVQQVPLHGRMARCWLPACALAPRYAHAAPNKAIGMHTGRRPSVHARHALERAALLLGGARTLDVVAACLLLLALALLTAVVFLDGVPAPHLSCPTPQPQHHAAQHRNRNRNNSRRSSACTTRPSRPPTRQANTEPRCAASRRPP